MPLRKIERQYHCSYDSYYLCRKIFFLKPCVIVGGTRIKFRGSDWTVQFTIMKIGSMIQHKPDLPERWSIVRYSMRTHDMNCKPCFLSEHLLGLRMCRRHVAPSMPLLGLCIELIFSGVLLLFSRIDAIVSSRSLVKLSLNEYPRQLFRCRQFI